MIFELQMFLWMGYVPSLRCDVLIAVCELMARFCTSWLLSVFEAILTISTKGNIFFKLKLVFFLKEIYPHLCVKSNCCVLACVLAPGSLFNLSYFLSFPYFSSFNTLLKVWTFCIFYWGEGTYLCVIAVGQYVCRCVLFDSKFIFCCCVFQRITIFLSAGPMKLPLQ